MRSAMALERFATGDCERTIAGGKECWILGDKGLIEGNLRQQFA